MFTMRKRKSEYVGAGEVIGTAILKALKNHGLVKEVLLNGRWILRLTDAGKMALDRMKKRADEQ
jgi:ribosomal protein S19E (S16A)